jgi:hypothetical protein
VFEQWGKFLDGYLDRHPFPRSVLFGITFALVLNFLWGTIGFLRWLATPP